MIYPYMKLREDAKVYEIKGRDGLRFEAVNGSGEVFDISERASDLLVDLEDGMTSPYHRRDFPHWEEAQMDGLLREMEANGLLEQNGRVQRYVGPLFLLRLCPLELKRSRLTGWTSLFLFFAGLPCFIAAARLGLDRYCGGGFDSVLDHIFSAILVIGSLVLHELAHAAAAVAVGGRSHEMGVLTLLIAPMGMYVACDPGEKASRLAHLIFAAAGCNANAVLGLICLLLCGCTGPFSYALAVAGLTNLILVVFNMLPASITDGGKVLSALVGVRDLHAKAAAFFFSRQERRRILRSGRGGRIPAYVIAALGQIVFVAVMILQFFPICG